MKRGFLRSTRIDCRTRFTRRASARTPGLGLWVLVMMAQLRSAMAVQS